MKTAIVILNWNGRPMLERFLPSVVENTGGEAEIIVADNGSTDDSISYLSESYPHVRTIILDQNYGFAEGYNKALEQVEADYYVLLNSDVEVTRGWLVPLIQFMDAHDDAAACQPKLLSAVSRDEFEYAGAAGGFIDRYGYPFCRGRLFDTVEKDKGQYDTLQEIHWATGACLMVRSEDYWRVGGLDGRFFAHCEEIDLCWRLRLLGRKIYCVPESQAYHLGGGTLPQGNSRKTFLNFRNNLTMLYKNLPEGELRPVMRVRWWLDYLAAFQTLFCNGNVADFKAVCRARRAFRKWRNNFADDRRKIQEGRVAAAVPDREPFSVVWQYYVRRKRFFPDLFSRNCDDKKH